MTAVSDILHHLEIMHGENHDTRARIRVSVQPLQDTRARLRVTWHLAQLDRRWSLLICLVFAWTAWILLEAVCYAMVAVAQAMFVLVDIPVVVMQRVLRSTTPRPRDEESPANQ